jgi:superfamily II DNA/RNA helicase
MQARMKESLPTQSKTRHIDELLRNLKKHLKQKDVVIIFVKTRELAHCLESFLKQENYKFGTLTGQNAGDGAPGKHCQITRVA